MDSALVKVFIKRTHSRCNLQRVNLYFAAPGLHAVFRGANFGQEIKKIVLQGFKSSTETRHIPYP